MIHAKRNPGAHPLAKPQKYQPDFRRYDRDKQRWLEQNPNASPEQIGEAFRYIASACGI